MKSHVVAALVLAWGMFASQPPLKSQEASSAQTPLANLKSLSAGMYYQFADRWQAMESAKPTSLTVKKFPKWYRSGSLSEMHFNYPGAKSPIQLDQRRPVFGIRLNEAASGLDTRHLILIRVAKKNNHRELTLIHAQYQGPPAVQPGLVDTALTSIADLTFTLTPKTDLKPGEYVLIYSDNDIIGDAKGLFERDGYQFGIK